MSETTEKKFDPLRDPVKNMTCAECDGPVYINGRWSERKWFVICIPCKRVTLETEEDPPHVSG